MTDQVGEVQTAERRGVQSGAHERSAEANRRLSDDEILGLGERSRSRKANAGDQQAERDELATLGSEEVADGAERNPDADGQPTYSGPAYV